MNTWRQAKARNRQEALENAAFRFRARLSKKRFLTGLWIKNGLYFSFNPYSLGGYVDTAYFTLPANKLQGIVKPEWLHQSQGFHKTAKD